MHAIPYRPAWLLCLAIASIISSGCHLDRRGLGPAWPNTIAPEQYCPGDTLTSSYDFLGELACADGMDCSPFFPNVDFTSNPAVFPPQRVTGYTGSVSFTPTVATVDITQTVDRSVIEIPTNDFMGVRTLSALTLTQRATRLDAPIEESQVYGGFCAGMSHAYETATLGGPPRLSARLALTEICNASPVPIVVSAPGGDIDLLVPLSVGECAAVPDGLRAGSMLSARPQVMDPMARCGAIEGGAPPRPLQTRARLACR